MSPHKSPYPTILQDIAGIRKFQSWVLILLYTQTYPWCICVCVFSLSVSVSPSLSIIDANIDAHLLIYRILGRLCTRTIYNIYDTSNTWSKWIKMNQNDRRWRNGLNTLKAQRPLLHHDHPAPLASMSADEAKCTSLRPFHHTQSCAPAEKGLRVQNVLQGAAGIDSLLFIYSRL